MSQCTNPCREVRQLAFSALQRTLLSADLTNSDPTEWTAIFGKVLFPLILTLLKPEVFSTDKEGMSEMRVQSASLLCKVFLQYLVLLAGWDGMLDLWVKVIEIMDRLMNSGQGDSLVSLQLVIHHPEERLTTAQEEAVRENLKNVVLYMVSSGTLVPPEQDPSRKELWHETWKRVDRFLPDLRAEIAPEPEATKEVVVPVVEKEQGQAESTKSEEVKEEAKEDEKPDVKKEEEEEAEEEDEDEESSEEEK